MKGYFVTGTDTGVGKTVLTAALVALARSRGEDVVPMKPIQTGCDERDGELLAPDLEDVFRLSDMAPSRAEQADMCPYRFKPPCSPHLAAKMAGEAICAKTIDRHFRSLADRHDAVIVEGAGGVLVPLCERLTMLGLIRDCGLPALVAARPGLGTINHSLMTVRTLQSAGVEVAAIVMVRTGPEDTDAFETHLEEDNRNTVNALSGVPVLGPIPFIPELNSPDFTPEAFRAIVSSVVSSLYSKE